MNSLSIIELSVAFAADGVWHIPSPFQKKSQQLWIELNRVKKAKVGSGQCTVRTVIPASRLASYVDSPYDAEREAAYPADSAVADLVVSGFDEPWMLPEVEVLFQKLRGGSVQTVRLVHSVAVARWIQEEYPGLAKNCQPYDVDIFGLPEVYELPSQLLELRDLKEIELQMRIKSTKKLWEPRIFSSALTSLTPDRPTKLAPCRSANCIWECKSKIRCKDLSAATGSRSRSYPYLPSPKNTPTDPCYDLFLNPAHLVRSVASDLTFPVALKAEEWIVTEAYRQVRGFPEFTNLLRKTRSKHEDVEEEEEMNPRGLPQHRRPPARETQKRAPLRESPCRVQPPASSTWLYRPFPPLGWSSPLLPFAPSTPGQSSLPLAPNMSGQSYSLFTDPAPKDRLYRDVLNKDS